MEPIHPTECAELKDALCLLLIVGVVLVASQYLLGHWDKFLVQVDWLIHGVMGLWGE